MLCISYNIVTLLKTVLLIENIYHLINLDDGQFFKTDRQKTRKKDVCINYCDGGSDIELTIFLNNIPDVFSILCH